MKRDCPYIFKDTCMNSNCIHYDEKCCDEACIAYEQHKLQTIKATICKMART
jgi:hypothetical protein